MNKNKKYDIFVSSTYEDLKEDRLAIHDAILKSGHVPIGMEYFMASSSSQWEIIQPLIDKCDYYILILGSRYGSIDSESKLSYTEKEYNYAISIAKPILVFILEENKISQYPITPKKDIENFKTKVKNNNRTCQFPRDKNSLSSDIIIALNKEFNSNPQDGWVRGNTIHTDEVNELNIINYKEMDEIFTIEGYIDGYPTHNWTEKLSWKEIFLLISDNLAEPKVDELVKYGLAQSIYSVNEQYVGQGIENITINSFREISRKLKLFGLTEMRKLKTTQGKPKLFWVLTSKGEQFKMDIKRYE